MGLAGLDPTPPYERGTLYRLKRLGRPMLGAVWRALMSARQWPLVRWIWQMYASTAAYSELYWAITLPWHSGSFAALWESFLNYALAALLWPWLVYDGGYKLVNSLAFVAMGLAFGYGDMSRTWLRYARNVAIFYGVMYLIGRFV